MTGGPRIGDAEASAVAAVMGTQFSVVSGGILSLMGLAAIALAMPEFGRLDMAKAKAAAAAGEAAAAPEAAG